MPRSFVTLPAIAVALLLACVMSGALAQTTSHASAYVGQQSRAIKALSEQDVVDLLAGRGAGFAKAAELNGYLGPAHVLELKEPLELDEAQIAATEALMIDTAPPYGAMARRSWHPSVPSTTHSKATAPTKPPSAR